MKIAQVINSMQVGGAQRLVADLCEKFVAGGDDVTLILINKSHDESILANLSDAVNRNQSAKGNLKICRLDLPVEGRTIFSILAIRKLRKILRDFDIIHAHLFPSIYLVSIAGRGLRGRKFMTEHNTHNHRREYSCLRPVEKLIYSGYDCIVAISPAAEDCLRKWLGMRDCDVRKIVTIPNGINLSRFRPEFHNISSYLSLENSAPYNGIKEFPIVMTSRFVESKDHLTLIEAMETLKRRFDGAGSEVDGCPVCPVLYLAGVGETLTEIKNSVKSRGLDRFVKFLGSVTDIPELLHNSKIGVVSSRWEGFGLSAVEMMAAGLPVIASDVPGLREVVKNAGIIFKAGDHIQLAGELESLIRNPEKAKRISQQCRKRAEEYDIRNTVASYRIFYRTL